MLDISRLRQETPGCLQLLHLNNAGASLSPSPVVKAIKDHLDLEALIGGYEAQDQAKDKIAKFYTNAASLIQCAPDEIAFTENATRSWDMAFYSLPFKPGDKILTGVSEYASNYLAFLHIAKQTGVNIEVIANDEFGQLSLVDLLNKLNDNVKLIAVTHVPTQGGLINPAQAVGEIAKNAGIFYLLDATQSIGQMPMNVKELQCDFLCATGRKFLRGPRGTGFLYVKKENIEKLNPPFIDLFSASWDSEGSYSLQPNAQRFETWEQNIAAKIGLSTAIGYALTLGLDKIWHRIHSLGFLLRESLANIDIQHQDLGKEKCGIVTFNSEKKSAKAIQDYLKSKQCNVSISIQEYARLDLGRRGIKELVRASVHYYNTEEEIVLFCSHLEEFLK